MASEAQKAWDFLLADLRDPRTHTLSILGATGWETFAAVNSPLHEAIKKFSGEIRILLIDPRSAHLDKRAATVSSKPADYRRDIANSQTFIDDLKVRGANVDVRLYRDVPGWKLIITNNLCWMQYYSRNHHVAETPIYLFYNSNNAATLYHRFCWEFAKVWTGAPAKGRKPKA